MCELNENTDLHKGNYSSLFFPIVLYYSTLQDIAMNFYRVILALELL